MKPEKNIIIKSITLSVLVLYLVMVCAFTFLIPKYNQASVTSNAKTTTLQRDNNSSNSFVQVHCAFKSVPENKRKTLDVLMKTVSLIFLMVFGAKVSAGSIKETGFSINNFLYPQQHYYLSLRTLRI